MRRYYQDGNLVGGQVKIAKAAPPRDKITGADFKVLRKKAMGGGMMRKNYRAGGDTHVTKEGKTAKKGLWYIIAQKRKRGEKMRAKGTKGAPTEKAIKASQA